MGRRSWALLENPKIASAERTGHILQNFVRLKEMDSAAVGN